MGRVRTVVLGAVLTAVSVLGAAPAASADTSGLKWNVYGGVMGYDGAVSVSDGSGPLPTGQTVAVQALVNGAWVTRHTYTVTDASAWGISPTKAEMATRPGRFEFRAVTRFPGATIDSVSYAAITVAPDDGYVDTHVSALSTTTATDRVVSVSLQALRRQPVELQRWSAAGWVRVGLAYATAADLHFAVPVRAGLSSYRVIDHPSVWSTGYITDPFTIHQTDMARYSGYIATARQYMAAFCPKTPIYIDTPGVTGATAGDRVGLENSGWSTSGDGMHGTLSSTIELRSGMTGAEFRHIALHECAHVLQGRAAVVGRWDIEQSRAYQIFGSVGPEGEADCMAYLYVRYAAGLYYLPSCSAAQLTEADRMWHTYGLKYQAVPYKW